MANKKLSKSALLAIPMLIGATIGLALIVVYLLGVKNPNPAWGKFWMLRPLLLVPFAGAMAGVFYYLMNSLRNQGGKKKILANVLSLLVLLIGLFMGVVLGLDGTLWD